MGWFSKKRTTVENIKEKKVFQEIVKLSYVESLAINSGVISISDLTPETEEETIEVTNENSKELFGESGSYKRRNSDNIGALIGGIVPGLGSLIGGFIGSLFGKKVTKDIKGTIKDSGWNYVRDWNEPYFDIIRYAIGIKELALSQFTYETVSEVISTPWISPKEIQKVSLLVDQFIPSQFPVGNSYIEYYIKPEIPEVDWIRINPVDLPTVYSSDNKIVPRIITFNTERPINSRLEESYIETSSPVTSVRFRAILKRPTELDSGENPAAYSPLLKSYRLVMTPRGGL